MNIQGIDQADLLKSYLSSANGVNGISSSSDANATSDSASTGGVDFQKIIMAQLDTDGDGKISSEELAAGSNKLTGALSQLNDITSQMRAHTAKDKNTSVAANLIGELDSNGNSTLDITESGLTQDEFKKIDIDGNGQLSQNELSALADKAKGSNASTKITASQSECVSILSQLQSKGYVRQYEAAQSAKAA